MKMFILSLIQYYNVTLWINGSSRMYFSDALFNFYFTWKGSPVLAYQWSHNILILICLLFPPFYTLLPSFLFSFFVILTVFTNWGPWGSCSSSCGAGIQVRVRVCTNPPPINGFTFDCQGPRSETQPCNVGPHRFATSPKLSKIWLCMSMF